MPLTKTLNPKPYSLNPGPSVFDLHGQLEDNYRKVREILRQIEEKDEDSRVRLAAAAELRQHLAVAEKVLETAVEAAAVQQFQDIVLETLAKIDPAIRRRILNAFNAKANRFRKKPNRPKDSHAP